MAANRLPVEVKGDGQLNPSPGGLASALSSVTAAGTQWVGWAGPEAGRPKPFDYGDLRLHPIALSSEDLERYYQGFANAILWPLFHGRLRRVELNRAWWHSYRIVNRRFAAEVCRIAPHGGTVWVHDYHLLLAPAIIRAKRPDLRIGLFLHIPFPNAQLFSMLPWRKEVIRGMLGADVLGFQVPEDADNFMAAADRLVGARVRNNILFDGVHTVDVDAFPISIDFDHWSKLGEDAEADAARHRKEVDVESIFLGIDRLDYTKGISQRLKAFGELLDDGTLDAQRCAFVQVAVPSRSDVAAYEDERDEVESLIEAINTRHKRADGSVPVVYMDSSLDEVDVAAWFRAADSLVVTSLADGMNLVAKEFVGARGDLAGTLILSEFAGAAQDLDGALIVNPYDIEAIKRALVTAINMPQVEVAARMKTMRDAVKYNDVHRWARNFLNRLQSTAVRAGDLPLQSDSVDVAAGDTVRPIR
ncbi:MAG TPA: trehalose-6-phosphate synthase [Ilumatobacteraceae bacterium]|nr:trehalose-6-phosphate synthase [Ilumatobacteraceae bacterium]